MTTTSLLCNNYEQIKDGDKTTKPSLNVKNGKIDPQCHESNNRRPLTPFLSFGQSNPFEATRDGSKSSPLYLTPPASGDASSPPPQKEGDGYFGPNTRQRTRRKPRTTPGAVSRSPSAKSGNISPDQHAETRDLVTESTLYGSSDIGMEDPLRTPVVSSAKEKTREPHMLRFETLTCGRTASGKAQPDSNNNVAEHHAHNHGSSAVRILRRYSEASVHAGTLDPPPLLQSISSTLNMFFASKNLGVHGISSDEEVEGTTDVTSRKKSKNRISHAAKGRRRAKTKQRTNPTASLNIPATITLRKASASCQSGPKTGTNKEAVTAENVHENGPAFGAAVTVMTLQSISFDSTCLSSSVEHQPRIVTLPKNASEEPGAARQRAISVTGIGGTSEVPRHSLLAETALSLQEAHRDAGKFTISPNPRRHSVSAAGILRRFSTIRAGLRGSVHEIIWHEDQPPSGTCSQTSVSPTRKESLPGTINDGTEPRPFDDGFAGTEFNFGAAALSEHGSSSEESRASSTILCCTKGNHTGTYSAGLGTGILLE